MHVDLSQPISTEHRAGRMLQGLLDSTNRKGKVVLTCELAGAKTYHQAFAIRRWKNRDDELMLTFEVKGSGDYHAGIQPIKVMHINVAKQSCFEARDDRNRDALLVYAAHAALMFAWSGTVPTPANGSVTVVEEDMCACCGLELTDPESIARGIGPTCYGKTTGKRTITGRKAQTQLLAS